MKHLITCISATILLCGCSSYTQIVSISPTSENIIKNADNFYEFENADLKIRYSFWAEHGIMGFLIYNKTDHPIYIDWKKSNMINGSRQQPYYTNKTTSNFSTYGTTYGTSWLNIFNSVSSSYARTTVGTETIVKEERISFISPHSYIANAFYNLVANIYFDVNNNNTEEKQVQGYNVFVSTSDYHINFRNYITYSEHEDFNTEKHIDNGFNVSKVYTMKNEYAERGNWTRPYRFYITNLQQEDINNEHAQKL